MQVARRRYTPSGRGLIILGLGIGLSLVYVFSRDNPVATNLAKIDSMYEGYRKEFPKIEEITAEEFLRRSSKETFVLVDVRTDKEMKTSVIPGAISKSEFDAKRANLQKVPIIAYCTIGYRSGLFAKELATTGVLVYNLRGGILAWAHAGQLFSSSTGTTRTAHVYGEQWNLLPTGYHGVW